MDNPFASLTIQNNRYAKSMGKYNCLNLRNLPPLAVPCTQITYKMAVELQCRDLRCMVESNIGTANPHMNQERRDRNRSNSQRAGTGEDPHWIDPNPHRWFANKQSLLDYS
jgi:hypothetical protein